LGHSVKKNSAPGKEEDRDQSFLVALLRVHRSKVREELLLRRKFISAIPYRSPVSDPIATAPVIFHLLDSGHYTVAGWPHVNYFIFCGNMDLRELDCV
jgi:hypothetical protein